MPVTVTVEIAFDSDPGAASPTWTDVTTVAGVRRIRSVQCSRGRQRELDRFQAGTATFVLDNRDRAFDPEYASSPYAGKVVPMKRIRWRATYNAVTYDIFDGYIDSWDQQYVYPRDAVAVVRATDAFKVLAAAQLPTSAYAAEVLADEPVGWWRLGEAAGETVARDSVGDFDLTMTGSGVTFGVDSLVTAESDTAAQFDQTVAAEQDGLQAYGPALVTTAPMSFELIYQYVGPVTDGFLGGHFSGYAGAGIAIAVNATTLSAVFSTGQSAFTILSAVVADLQDGNPHHIVAVWEADGDIRLYVDGTERDSDTRAVAALPDNAWVAIGGAAFADEETAEAILDEVALYDTALSSTRVLAHYNAMATAWASDTPGTRIGRVLDFIDWPAGSRNLDTGSSALQAVELDRVTALDHLQKVAESEFGELYMTGAGVVRFEGRAAQVNQPNNGTFGDGSGELKYFDVSFDYSDQLLRNEVIVSRVGGVPQRAEDATSITAYLRHTYSRDGLIHDDDDVSRAAAQFLVAQYKDPLLRVTSLDVAPRRDEATLYPQVLGRELTDVVTVVRRPQGVGSALSIDSRIEGIQHQFESSGNVWRTTWNLSPAFTATVGAWDDTGSLWDDARWGF